MLEPLNENSSVKKVIGIVSGKGGVGKSMVTSMLAVLLSRKGYNTAILDADITPAPYQRLLEYTDRFRDTTALCSRKFPTAT